MNKNFESAILFKRPIGSTSTGTFCYLLIRIAMTTSSQRIKVCNVKDAIKALRHKEVGQALNISKAVLGFTDGNGGFITIKLLVENSLNYLCVTKGEQNSNGRLTRYSIFKLLLY